MGFLELLKAKAAWERETGKKASAVEMSAAQHAEWMGTLRDLFQIGPSVETPPVTFEGGLAWTVSEELEGDAVRFR